MSERVCNECGAAVGAEHESWCPVGTAERIDRLEAALGVERAKTERMYQRALDAEAHARFGPMDVDERVRLLRNLVDVTEERLREAERLLRDAEVFVRAGAFPSDPGHALRGPWMEATRAFLSQGTHPQEADE